jgi:hypothetical protein
MVFNYFSQIMKSHSFSFWRSILTFGRLAYPTSLALDWRPTSWPVTALPNFYPRVGFYYDYSFRTFLVDLALRRRPLAGFDLTHPYYNLVAGGCLTLIWWLGAGHRFAPTNLYPADHAIKDRLSLAPDNTLGFYDVVSPLALAFRAYYYARIFRSGLPELHYRLNPTFFLYTRSQDLDRFPFNGERPRFKDTPVPFYRHLSYAFTAEDQHFLSLALYYDTHLGRLQCLLNSVVCVWAALMFVPFHFFLRTPLFYLFYYWARFQLHFLRGESHIGVYDAVGQFLTKTFFSPWGVYWNLVTAQVPSLVHLPYWHMGWWRTVSQAFNARNFFAAPRLWLPGLAAAPLDLAFRWFPQNITVGALSSTVYYRQIYQAADSELATWIYARVLTKAQSVPPLASVSQRSAALTASATIGRAAVLASRSPAWILGRLYRFFDNLDIAPSVTRTEVFGYKFFYVYLHASSYLWTENARSFRALEHLLTHVATPIRRILRRTRVILTYALFGRAAKILLIPLYVMGFFILWPFAFLGLKPLPAIWYWAALLARSTGRGVMRLLRGLIRFTRFARSIGVGLSSHIVSFLRTWCTMLATHLKRLPSVLPLAVSSSFSVFVLRLRDWSYVRLAYHEFFQAKAMFLKHHGFAIFDNWATDDEEYEDNFQTSLNLSQTADPKTTESDFGYHVLDAADSAFPVSELYGKAGLDSEWGDDESHFDSGNFHLDSSQHSPHVDRIVSTDFFADDAYQREAGFDEFLLWNFLILDGNIYRWLDRRPLLSRPGAEAFARFPNLWERMPEDALAYDQAHYSPTGFLGKLGYDPGTTELSAHGFAQLTSFANQYRNDLATWAEKQPGRSLVNLFQGVSQGAGAGFLPLNTFSRLRRREWIELTLFVDSLTTGRPSALSTELAALDAPKVAQVWERFSERAQRSPELLLKRIADSPNLPSAFANYVLYPGAVRRAPFSVVDPLFRFFLGLGYKETRLYRLFFAVFSWTWSVAQEGHLQFRGDTRLLRLLSLYFGGFLPPQAFEDEFSQLPKSPQAILAAAAYFRQLAAEDFGAFRAVVAKLPASSHLFSIFFLALSSPSTDDTLTATISPVGAGPFSTSDAEHYLRGAYGWRSRDVPDGPSQRNRMNFVERHQIPPRHPLAALPYAFIADFFDFLTTGEYTPKPNFLVFYRFRDFLRQSRHNYETMQPRSEEEIEKGRTTENQFFGRPQYTRLTSTYGYVFEDAIREQLERERMDIWDHRGNELERLFMPSHARFYRNLLAYHQRFKNLIKFRGRRAYEPGTDMTELFGSAGASPFLRFFLKSFTNLAATGVVIPPQFTNTNFFRLDFGSTFEDLDSEPVDLYDEPLSVTFNTAMETDEDFETPRIEKYDLSGPYSPFAGSLGDEDGDNYAGNFSSKNIDNRFYDENAAELDAEYQEEFLDTSFDFTDELAGTWNNGLEVAYFFERESQNFLTEVLEEDEWQQDRFELADGTSIPLARLFFGGLPTRGAFPATDPRLFLGAFSETGPLDTSLHYQHNFKKASAAAFSTSLVSLSSVDLTQQRPAPLLLVVRALGSGFVRFVTYAFLFLRDLTYGPLLQDSVNNPHLAVARVHLSTLAHYQQWSTMYGNKYYFAKYSQALKNWIADFESYLAQDVRTAQYHRFSNRKAFGPALPGLKRSAAFTRFDQSYPFGSLPYLPDGSYHDNPGNGRFPFSDELYYKAWRAQYLRGIGPDRPDPDTQHILQRVDRLGPASWYAEPFTPEERFFFVPNLMEKWDLYERARFATFLDAAAVGPLGPERSHAQRRSPAPTMGISPELASLGTMPNWVTDNKTTGPESIPYFTAYDDVTDQDHFTEYFEGHYTEGGEESFPLDFTGSSKELYHELAEFGDPEDALLFSYATDADFSTHFNEFVTRFSIFAVAVREFCHLLHDYTVYGFELFSRTYLFGPFHYWVVYSEKFWLTLSLRVGFWINLLRYLFSVTLFLAVYIYLFVLIPRVSYFFLSESSSTSSLIIFNGLLSLFFVLFLPYFFFNPVYRYYHSLWPSERFMVVVVILLVYFENVFYGYRPPGDRIETFFNHPATYDNFTFWRELNLDLPAPSKPVVYDRFTAAYHFQPWDQRENNFVAFDMQRQGLDNFHSTARSRRIELMDEVKSAYRGEDYWLRELSFSRADLPSFEWDPAYLYYNLKAYLLNIRTEFFTGFQALRVFDTSKQTEAMIPAYSSLITFEDTENQVWLEDFEAPAEIHIATNLNQLAPTIDSALTVPPSTIYGSPSDDDRFHHFPISPISGAALAGDNTSNSRSVLPYDFRPTSYYHEPYYQQSHAFVLPTFDYNGAGLSPRNRASFIRVPDFVDLTIDEETEVDNADPELVDLELLESLAWVFGESTIVNQKTQEEGLELPYALEFYAPEEDGLLHILQPQAYFHRRLRMETFDSITLTLFDLEEEVDQPISDEIYGEFEIQGIAPEEEPEPAELILLPPDEEDPYEEAEILSDVGVNPAIFVDGASEVREVDYAAFAADEDGADYDIFYYHNDVRLYDWDNATPITDIYEVALPEVEEILTSRLDQPDFLYERYFNLYSHGDWGYRRDLLNSAYSAPGRLPDHLVRQAQYYHFMRMRAADAHFTDFYAKNLRDFLLAFKPHSSFVFGDIYAPDLPLRLISRRLAARPDILSPRSQWIYRTRSYAYDRNSENHRWETKLGYMNPLPPPQARADFLESFPFLKMYEGANSWSSRFLFDLGAYTAAQELLWQLTFPRLRLVRLGGGADHLEVARALTLVRRHAKISALSKRFSDFYAHRALVPGARPADLVAHVLDFEATLLPRLPELGGSVLDPTFDLLGEEFPDLVLPLLSGSASHIPVYTPYAVGHTQWRDNVSVPTDPLEIYDFEDTQPLYTFPVTVARSDHLRHSFLFDSDDVYAPLYANFGSREFLHFLTYPLLDDDYLSAIARYEQAIGPYLVAPDQPDRWVTNPLELFGFDMLHSTPGNPLEGEEPDESDAGLLGYVDDMSVRWEEWGEEEVDPPWEIQHFVYDLYPLKRGVFADRNLASLRNRDRSISETGDTDFFVGLSSALVGRRQPLPEETVPDDDKLRRPRTSQAAMAQLPVLLDRLLAISDYTRIHSLHSVYFSEYRKLLLAGPDELVDGIIPISVDDERPFDFEDIETEESGLIIDPSVLEDFFVDINEVYAPYLGVDGLLGATEVRIEELAAPLDESADVEEGAEPPLTLEDVLELLQDAFDEKRGVTEDEEEDEVYNSLTEFDNFDVSLVDVLREELVIVPEGTPEVEDLDDNALLDDSEDSEEDQEEEEEELLLVATELDGLAELLHEAAALEEAEDESVLLVHQLTAARTKSKSSGPQD